MIDSIDKQKYIELYRDFLHPNPKISFQAIFLLRKEFRVKFKNNLLSNLKEEDLIIRRRSILALGEYGEEILKSILLLYSNSKDKSVKVSCLKIIIKVIVNLDLKQLNQEVMTVIGSALEESSPAITLTVISLLRQLGKNGRDMLIKTSRDKDLLKAKASVSALLEIKDQTVDNLFDELLHDQSIDPMIKEDIIRDKMT